jgi:hypothetical protein
VSLDEGSDCRHIFFETSKQWCVSGIAIGMDPRRGVGIPKRHPSLRTDDVSFGLCDETVLSSRFHLNGDVRDHFSLFSHRKGKRRLINNRFEISHVSQGSPNANADFRLIEDLLLERANDAVTLHSIRGTDDPYYSALSAFLLQCYCLK